MFYLCFGLAAAGWMFVVFSYSFQLFLILWQYFNISDHLVLMGLLNFSLRKSPLFVSAANQMTLLLKAMCLANIAKFFLLPIVIWKTQQSDFVVQLNFMLVIGYFICGLIHVHSGDLTEQMSFELCPEVGVSQK